MSWEFRRWYAKNRRKLNRDKALRYQEDPEYRARIKKSARKRYREVQLTRQKKDLCRIVDDRGNQFVSISRVADVIHRKVYTVREYHRKGVIPDVLYVDTRGWRLYSIAQVLLLQRVFKKFDSGALKNLKEVSKIVHSQWEIVEEENGEQKRSA